MKKDFFEAYKRFCLLKQLPPSVEECTTYYDFFEDENLSDDDKINVLKLAEKRPFSRPGKNRNGEVIDIPRMPTVNELLALHESLINVCDGVSEDLKTKRPITKESHKGHFVCSMVSYFACQPGFVWEALDKKVISVPDDYMDTMLRLKGVQKKQYVYDLMSDFIDFCDKLNLPTPTSMPSLAQIIGSAQKNDIQKKAVS